MDLFYISDTILDELPSFLQLASYKYQLSVAEVESYKVSAFIRQNSIVISVKFDLSMLNKSYFIF
jgi:hypothetical protein